MPDRPSLDTVLAGGSAAFRRLNPQVSAWTPIVKGPIKPPDGYVEIPKPKKRLRQSTKPLLNKLETEFQGYMNAMDPTTRPRPQAKRYELARGAWYKPDFTAIVNGFEHCWEVKGPHAFKGALLTLKVAARVWPDVYWWLCWKGKGGTWEFQRVLP